MKGSIIHVRWMKEPFILLSQQGGEVCYAWQQVGVAGRAMRCG